ncbi:MAG: hypothetical protein OXM03_09165 [Chloroflexota bacterium]|nr:hypothetical protein [Chloroflexota bacterium]MDE2840782.1 hypothetical protein [Chloroflexota bacterium]MDE2929530.1 hypothetical protein [Chloroflexota bacterium]
MPTVGEDCSVILDGHGYFVKPGSFRLEIPKVMAAEPDAAAGPAAVNLGTGKQVWHFTALAYTNHLNHNGTVNATSAATYRANLRTSYAKAEALAFTDRLGAAHRVHMVALEERISEAAGFWEQPEWEIAITLVEA